MLPLDPGTDSLVGQTLDSRYQVEARIGRGGMGEVYLARHLLLGSRVALKVLAGDRAGDPSAARRFVREARSTFRVDHPHCVRVIDLGSSGAALYIVMEYLDGRTVADELRADGPIGSGRAARIGSQAAAALAHAHGLGLVHRDLKPDNIMLIRRGEDPDFVKVLDFGLARVFDERADLAGTAISLAPLTGDGLVFGTPEYMSPEQASGGRVGPPGDVYSLGAVLYHMVTGVVPFSGQTFTEILSRHVRDAPVPPRVRCPDRAIAVPLERVILDCLEKLPERRPPGAGALSAQLDQLAGVLGCGPRQAAHGTAATDRVTEPTKLAAAETQAAETIDLSPHQVKLAAAETRSAKTVDLAPPGWPGAGADRVAVGPAAMAARGATPGLGSRRPGRKLLLVGSGAAIAALLVAIALGMGGESSTGRADGVDRVLPEAGSSAPPPEGARFGAGRDGADRPPAGPAQRPDTAREAAHMPPASAPVSPGTAPGSAVGAGGGRTANQLRADRHVRAAEAARRSGNLLRQLAEADQAHRLDPQNRRAALLMGEALVKSGDRANGCRLLRSSMRLFRRAGCSD